MLEQTFLQVIDMSFTAAIIIGIVLIARIFLKRLYQFLGQGSWIFIVLFFACSGTDDATLVLQREFRGKFFTI